MRKQILITSLASVLFFVPELSQASVCALGSTCSENGFKHSEIDFKNDANQQCLNSGYTITSCPEGKIPQGACPYKDGYYQKCVCNTSRYVATNSDQCGSLATTESCTDERGTHYKCDCDTSIMTPCSSNNQYMTASPSCMKDGVAYVLKTECRMCQAPSVVNSSKTGCECPSSYEECDTSNNEIGSGMSCTVGEIVKYEFCGCPSTYKQCDFGGEAGAKKCTMNGVDYWESCKGCQNLGEYASCPDGYVCTYEDCSQKYYITGCAIGSVNIDDPQCSWYKCWGVVSSK